MNKDTTVSMFRSLKADRQESKAFRSANVLTAFFCKTNTLCRFVIEELPHTVTPYRKCDSNSEKYAVLAVSSRHVGESGAIPYSEAKSYTQILRHHFKIDVSDKCCTLAADSVELGLPVIEDRNIPSGMGSRDTSVSGVKNSPTSAHIDMDIDEDFTSNKEKEVASLQNAPTNKPYCSTRSGVATLGGTRCGSWWYHPIEIVYTFKNSRQPNTTHFTKQMRNVVTETSKIGSIGRGIPHDSVRLFCGNPRIIQVKRLGGCHFKKGDTRCGPPPPTPLCYATEFTFYIPITEVRTVLTGDTNRSELSVVRGLSVEVGTTRLCPPLFRSEVADLIVQRSLRR
ncbi:hypothetical protein J6590_019842 [Homalodisca vitripennis]|nr:hypothetical protein J6590_019842 [Homalodisca vitripennis]